MANRFKDEKGRLATTPPERDTVVVEKTGSQHANGGRFNGNVGGRQFVANPLFDGIYVHGMQLLANGGTVDNPMGFPGYGDLYTGNPATYRWMLQHPVLAFVATMAVDPIRAALWKYVKSETGVPDAYANLIQRIFDPIRIELIDNFLAEGRNMGWAGGEPIWEIKNGETILKRVKPLLQDSTDILEDSFGNFTGLRNYVKVGERAFTDIAAPYKAWKFTFGPETYGQRGRSWLENVRATAWKEWLDCAQQIQKLGTKISGTVTIVTSPAGTFPGDPDPETGVPKQVSYRSNAETAIKALANGAAGVWFPSVGLIPDEEGNLDMMKLMAELAGQSLTNFQVLDFGSHSPAIEGFLSRMRHAEEIMFMGGFRSARTGMEAAKGAKADAEVHTDTATLNSETDAQRFAKSLQPLVNAALFLNFGPNAVDKVQIAPASLVDRLSAVLKAVINSGMNVPEIAIRVFKSANVDEMMKILGVPQKTTFEAPDDPEKPSERIPRNTGVPSPTGGRPPKGAVKKP